MFHCEPARPLRWPARRFLLGDLIDLDLVVSLAAEHGRAHGEGVGARIADRLRGFRDPASGQITLNLETSATGNASVTITNVVGEKIKEFTMPVNKNYDLNLDVPSGLYFINATSGSKTFSGKIIINK